MKLILHIGTEKTGSTSFQKWGDRNRDVLLKHGICYSRVLGRENHLKIYLWALPPNAVDEGFAQAGIHSPLERQVFLNTLPEQFSQEVRRARERGCHTFLISNEHCHSRLKTEADLERLKGFLAPHFQNIEILCSLRPQIDVAISLMSTAARVGLHVNRAFFDQATESNGYYNYANLVTRWSNVFGAEAVTLVPFRRRPDIATVMIDRLRLDPNELESPPRLNESLDVRVIAMANAVNAAYREAGDGTPKPNLMLDVMPCTQKLQPGLELAQVVQARFAKSNSQLAYSRPEVTLRDLEPDWSRYDMPSNLHLLDQDCVFSEPLLRLLDLFQQRIALARALEMAASAERAQCYGNIGPIAEFLREARQNLAQISERSVLYDQRRDIEARLKLIG